MYLLQYQGHLKQFIKWHCLLTLLILHFIQPIIFEWQVYSLCQVYAYNQGFVPVIIYFKDNGLG